MNDSRIGACEDRAANTLSNTRPSNWTLATGTRPDKRDVYPTVSQGDAPKAVTEPRS
jgi:hypothetical protein